MCPVRLRRLTCYAQAMHKGDVSAFSTAQACALAVAHVGSASALLVGTRLVALPGSGFHVAVWSCTAVAVVVLLASNSILLLMERNFEYDVTRQRNISVLIRHSLGAAPACKAASLGVGLAHDSEWDSRVTGNNSLGDDISEASVARGKPQAALTITPGRLGAGSPLGPPQANAPRPGLYSSGLGVNLGLDRSTDPLNHMPLAVECGHSDADTDVSLLGLPNRRTDVGACVSDGAAAGFYQPRQGLMQW